MAIGQLGSYLYYGLYYNLGINLVLVSDMILLTKDQKRYGSKTSSTISESVLSRNQPG